MARAEAPRYLNMAQRAEALPSPFPRPVEPLTPTREIRSEKISRRSFLKLGAAVGAGVAIGGAVEANPTLRALVNPYFQDLLAKWGFMERPVPAVFNNNANEGIIGANNTAVMPLSEIQKQFPQQVVQEGDKLFFLLLFQLPEGGRTEYKKSLSERLSTNKMQVEAEQKGIKEHIDFILPKGTNIILPATSRVLVEYGRSDWGQNPDSIIGFRFFFKQNDTTYYVWVFGPNKEDGFQSISSIPKSPLASINWSGTDWKNLPSFDQGTPIMRTLKDNQDIRFTVKAYKGGNVGGEAEIGGSSLLLTPQFFTQESGKLVALAK